MTDRCDADSDIDVTRRDFMKTADVASGAVVFGTGAAVATSGDQEGDTDDGDGDGDEQADEAPFAAVEFSNQESNGADVVVDSTVISEAGYVAFHAPPSARTRSSRASSV